MTKASVVQTYLVPACVFQSVIFGGSTATGREIVEFASRHGPVGGIFALMLGVIVLGVMLAASFELARRFHAYDYRNFFKRFLGPAWIAFEILFLTTLLMVLAVNGTAASIILEDTFGIPAIIGVAIALIAIVMITYYGREFVKKSLTFWAISLTIVMVIYVCIVVSKQGPAILDSFAEHANETDWLASGTSGLQYALYNLSIIPAILYCAANIKTRRDTICSGFFSAFVGVLPAIVFHITFMARFPEIVDLELPTYWMIQSLGTFDAFFYLYIIVMFAMIVQTGVGVLHGLNERMDGWSVETFNKPMSNVLHGTMSSGVLLISLLLSNFGIIALVRQGYGNLAWLYLVLYTIPLLTVGIWRIREADKTVNPPPQVSIN